MLEASARVSIARSFRPDRYSPRAEYGGTWDTWLSVHLIGVARSIIEDGQVSIVIYRI